MAGGTAQSARSRDPARGFVERVQRTVAVAPAASGGASIPTRVLSVRRSRTLEADVRGTSSFQIEMAGTRDRGRNEVALATGKGSTETAAGEMDLVGTDAQSARGRSAQ